MIIFVAAKLPIQHQKQHFSKMPKRKPTSLDKQLGLPGSPDSLSGSDSNASEGNQAKRLASVTNNVVVAARQAKAKSGGRGGGFVVPLPASPQRGRPAGSTMSRSQRGSRAGQSKRTRTPLDSSLGMSTWQCFAVLNAPLVVGFVLCVGTILACSGGRICRFELGESQGTV